MATQKQINRRRIRRAWRVRKAARGTSDCPRLSVHRSGKHIYAQFIDDDAGRTLCAVSSLELKLPYGGNTAAAKAAGEALGKKAASLHIVRCGFDRGAYRYHGRVKVFADAVRATGVAF